MAYNHGISTRETATPVSAAVGGDSGLQVVIGTAPVNMAADPAAAVNTPILANSLSEAVQALGYSDDFKSYSLCQSMAATFKLFGAGPVVFINVLDPATHKKTFTAQTLQLNNKQATLDLQGVLLDGLTVKDGTTASKTYALGKDYLAEFNTDGTLQITMIGDAASATTLTVNGNQIDASKVTAADIVGGVSAAGKETGCEVIRQVYPKLGMTPGILLAPGWSHDPTVAAALQGKCENINGFLTAECVLDIDCTSTGAKKYTDVKTKKEASGMTSEHAYALWPKFAVGDVLYAPSAIAAAAMSAKDIEAGNLPSLYIGNSALPITGLALDDGTEVILDQEQANVLNGAGVATAINANGYHLWGNNSCAYPATTDPKDRWFWVRRFFTWRRNSVALTYQARVDEPLNKQRLIENIVDSENITGNGFVSRGICAGYACSYNADDNPITEILNGHVQFKIALAPYTPAEFIEFVFSFDTSALETALNS